MCNAFVVVVCSLMLTDISGGGDRNVDKLNICVYLYLREGGLKHKENIITTLRTLTTYPGFPDH